MNIFRNKYIKFVFIFGIAYLISSFSTKNIFLGNSPKINPYAGQNMMAKVRLFWSKTTSLVAFKSGSSSSGNSTSSKGGLFNFSGNSTSSFAFVKDLPQNTQEAISAPLNKVSQGVYAGEKNDIKVFEVRIGELEYLEYTFIIDGKEKKIKVPKGQEPPSQEVLETIYK